MVRLAVWKPCGTPEALGRYEDPPSGAGFGALRKELDCSFRYSWTQHDSAENHPAWCFNPRTMALCLFSTSRCLRNLLFKEGATSKSLDHDSTKTLERSNVHPTSPFFLHLKFLYTFALAQSCQSPVANNAESHVFHKSSDHRRSNANLKPRLRVSMWVQLLPEVLNHMTKIANDASVLTFVSTLSRHENTVSFIPSKETQTQLQHCYSVHQRYQQYPILNTEITDYGFGSLARLSNHGLVAHGFSHLANSCHVVPFNSAALVQVC